MKEWLKFIIESVIWLRWSRARGLRCGRRIVWQNLWRPTGDLDVRRTHSGRLGSAAAKTWSRRSALARKIAWVIGPGIVVMLADTDAGNVVTAAQAGVQ